MTDLIKIEVSEGGKQIVNARDLWEWLESKQRFADWIKDKLRHGFEESKNYSIIEYDVHGNLIPSPTFINPTNQQTRIHKRDYILNLDCALAIVRAERYGKNKHELVKLLANHETKEIIIAKERVEFVFGREIVENLFSDYAIYPQFPVFGGEYYIDWYVPELNIAIEFDEKPHSSSKMKELDNVRQERIETNLGCKFLRYTV